MFSGVPREPVPCGYEDDGNGGGEREEKDIEILGSKQFLKLQQWERQLRKVCTIWTNDHCVPIVITLRL